MPNLFDYLKERGNLSFSEAPFNEVDNLILASLVYGDLGGCVPGLGKEYVSAADVRDRYKAAFRNKPVPREGVRRNAGPILEMMSGCRRFSGTRLGDFINIIDQAEEIQLAAMGVKLPDGSLYIAFRGTDSTLVGWKEDLQFSYMERTTGQVTAAEYINRTAKDWNGPIRVGGHSKGGNFAAYAAAFCRPEIKKRIVRVYSNDGPGMNEKVDADPRYKETLPKILKLVPEASIVGILLEDQTDFKIIASSEKGIMQHDPFTWQVEGDHFARVMSRSRSAVSLDITIAGWLAGLDPEQKKQFTEILFRVLEYTGAETVDDLRNSSVKAAAGIIAAMASLPAEDQKELWEIIVRLAQSGRQTAFGNLVLSQVGAAIGLTTTLSGISRAGINLVTGGSSDRGQKNSRSPIPDIPSLLDDRIMTDEVKRLMEKYDNMG